MNRRTTQSSEARSDLLARRRQMIDAHLRPRGIEDERVIEAMRRIPREDFLPQSLRQVAYDDRALPIDQGQTISQPYTVAFMCQALQLQGSERVLEVGTGSGYCAAVLSLLARQVYSVERLAGLAESATQRLARLGFDNVHVKHEDGTLGWPEQAPFDAIIVTAGGDRIPSPFYEQLEEDGRIVMPVGGERSSQKMIRCSRQNDEWIAENLGSFSFVPLIGRHGWNSAVT